MIRDKVLKQHIMLSLPSKAISDIALATDDREHMLDMIVGYLNSTLSIFGENNWSEHERVWIRGDVRNEFFMHPDIPNILHDLLPDLKLVFFLPDPIKHLSNHASKELDEYLERGILPSYFAQFTIHTNDSSPTILSDSPKASWATIYNTLRATKQLAYDTILSFPLPEQPFTLLECIYYLPMQEWLRYYPGTNSYFIRTIDEYTKQPEKVMNDLMQFLGVPPCKRCSELTYQSARILKDSDRKQIERLFEPFMVRLENLLDVNIRQWMQ